MLVVSVDAYNRGPAGLIVALPVTSTLRDIPIHVPVQPPEGGLRVESTILCDQIRALTRERFVHRLGRITETPLDRVDDRLRGLLRL